MKSTFRGRAGHWPVALFTVGQGLLGLTVGCSREQAPPAPVPSDPTAQQTTEPASTFYCQQTPQPVPGNDQAPPNFPRPSMPPLPSGSYSTTIQWQPSANGHAYQFVAGDTQLVVRVHSTTPPEWIARTVANRNPQGNVPAEVTRESLGCFDTVRTTATVSVVSGSGSLNESFPIQLEAQPSGVWIGRSEHALAALAGSFSAAIAVPEGYSPEQAPVLRGNWAIAGNTLVGDLELASGPLVDATNELREAEVAERIAHFPPGNQCDRSVPWVTVASLEKRATMSEALARLNATGPVTMLSEHANSPQGPLTMRFTESDSAICQIGGPPVHSVLLTRALLQMQSPNGRVAGSFPVELVVLHEPSLIEATAEVAGQAEALTNELPARLGIADPLDLTAYAGAFAQFASVLNDSGLSGHLQLTAAFADECATVYGTDAGSPPTGTDLSAPAGDAATPQYDSSVGSSTEGMRCGTQRLWAVSWGPSEEQ